MTGKYDHCHHLLDDWERPFTHGEHLTAADHAEIRRGFLAGELYRDVARRLKRSSRTISNHYTKLRAEGMVVRKRAPLAKDRFYHSDFEPS